MPIGFVIIVLSYSEIPTTETKVKKDCGCAYYTEGNEQKHTSLRGWYGGFGLKLRGLLNSNVSGSISLAGNI